MTSPIISRCVVLSVWCTVTLGVIGMTVTKPSLAQSWPDRPIRIVVPGPAGYGSDLSIRKISAELTKTLGQTVTIENRPGASGRIAMADFIRTNPDGYNFILADTTQIHFLPLTGAKIQYDQEKDVVPVARIGFSFPLVVVGIDSKIKTLSDFKTLGRPPTLGLVNLNSLNHATAVLLAQSLNMDFNFIPYANASPTKDVIGGAIDTSFMFATEAMGLVQSGRARVIATFDSKRNPKFPDSPSINEVSPLKSGIPAWSALYAVAGTPAPILEKMRSAVNQVLASDNFKNWIEALGSSAPPLDEASLIKFLEEQRTRAAAVIKSAGMKSD
jgi:tripartite-type tricarboxylate transporter receptor subunit TctC